MDAIGRISGPPIREAQALQQSQQKPKELEKPTEEVQKADAAEETKEQAKETGRVISVEA